MPDVYTIKFTFLDLPMGTVTVNLSEGTIVGDTPETSDIIVSSGLNAQEFLAMFRAYDNGYLTTATVVTEPEGTEPTA